MLNIVLYQPEICPNTGNIIRTCYALGAKLHIIKPLGFELLPTKLSRPAAGKLLSDIQHEIHASYSDFAKKYSDKNIFYITRYGLKSYNEPDFQHYAKTDGEIWVMFGRESTGIDKNILSTNIENCLRIPMVSAMRSMNLANCVSIIGFEIMRQLNFDGLNFFETQKGKHFLENPNE
ncbi:tRNA/rRNA methyltransferase [Mycoplasmopsis californica HAZ160_1]|uniref:Putative tRNA (cytidine(34)-2'-O)-methyltransferase n=1 Tax=Mycoplasmopsis californica HAZ160_1 TaxID=1397850 RepID=A0AAT9F8U9_9BACT|nr:tRNA (cytidine(34)-2'-O)-methyltransferase [Mycoplasmopsis californica]BAP01319.1 tRNA/rRNA methyltransferase [Mycoplasmopsis californica HAZ160_1]BBG41192.1 tRNA/rRNA methyltransferase [Mycoplasmopsis californica]BBG41785.1 tRNA/rRNA methyltransferase [Mycoplasmopsis californica]BBG42379.1 tRNA/rRNA methyltransferase [Mycoplasmopsis californica]BBG42954.1 tRNA/rRNA methyltransferase [Mycoplasmopsis californica]